MGKRGWQRIIHLLVRSSCKHPAYIRTTATCGKGMSCNCAMLFSQIYLHSTVRTYDTNTKNYERNKIFLLFLLAILTNIKWDNSRDLEREILALVASANVSDVRWSKINDNVEKTPCYVLCVSENCQVDTFTTSSGSHSTRRACLLIKKISLPQLEFTNEILQDTPGSLYIHTISLLEKFKFNYRGNTRRVRLSSHEGGSGKWPRARRIEGAMASVSFEISRSTLDRFSRTHEEVSPFILTKVCAHLREPDK